MPKTNVFHQSQILPGQLKQRHLEPNLYAIKFGTIANRPATPGEDGSYYAYFATDENKLYIYNTSSNAWVSVTLS